MGFTNAGIGRELAGGFDGAPVTTYWEGDRDVTVSLRLAPAFRQDVSSTYVISPVTGARVPLNSIATVSPRGSLSGHGSTASYKVPASRRCRAFEFLVPRRSQLSVVLACHMLRSPKPVIASHGVIYVLAWHPWALVRSARKHGVHLRSRIFSGNAMHNCSSREQFGRHLERPEEFLALEAVGGHLVLGSCQKSNPS